MQDWPPATRRSLSSLEVVEKTHGLGSSAGEATLDPIARDLRQQIDRDSLGAGRKELGVSDADAELARAGVRRLLLAWLKADQDDIGYAQAMAGIAMTLLVTADQSVPRAFLCFSQVMQSLPSFFYDEALRGCRIEVRTLWLLASARWPDELASRPAIRESFELVATQWFLSLWVGTLPPDECLAVWKRMVQAHEQPKEQAEAAAASAKLAAPFDVSLRVALALIATGLNDLVEAADADAAMDEEVDGGSGGAETYAAMRKIAARPDLASVVSAALEETQPGVKAVSSARGKACLQLEQHAAEETNRKAAARQQRGTDEQAAARRRARERRITARRAGKKPSRLAWTTMCVAGIFFVAAFIAHLNFGIEGLAAGFAVTGAIIVLLSLVCCGETTGLLRRARPSQRLARNDGAADSARSMEEAMA